MTDATRRLIQLSAAAAFLVTVLLLIGLLVWSDQPAVRYATLPCVYREIYGRTSPVDVVVVGSHGYGLLKRMAIGSVSEYVVHHCDVPVLVDAVAAELAAVRAEG